MDKLLKICSPAQVDLLCVIHYGSNKYDPDKVKIFKKQFCNKPRFGLWTSPLNSSASWRDWCINEGFRECKRNNSFILKFKSDSKILLIENVEDLIKLPIKNNLLFKTVNFYKLAKQYDAIWLTKEGEEKTRYSNPISLYGWDCETVLIFNKNCCYEVK